MIQYFLLVPPPPHPHALPTVLEPGGLGLCRNHRKPGGKGGGGGADPPPGKSPLLEFAFLFVFPEGGIWFVPGKAKDTAASWRPIAFRLDLLITNDPVTA